MPMSVRSVWLSEGEGVEVGRLEEGRPARS